MEILLYVVSDSGNWRSPRAGGDVPGRTATGDQSSHSRPWPSTRRAVEDRGWQVGVAPGGRGAGNRCTLEPQPVHLHSPSGEFYRERHPFIRQRTSHSFFHPLPGRDGVDRRQDFKLAGDHVNVVWPSVGRRYDETRAFSRCRGTSNGMSMWRTLRLTVFPLDGKNYFERC